MSRYFSEKRHLDLSKNFPLLLNIILLCIGIFILISMTVTFIIFEEFTAFTDYTQDWIEFNYFIHYWDRLTISRVYLSFIFIYGGVLLLIGIIQIHGFRKNNLTLMYFAPYLLVFTAVTSILGSLAWLLITTVNFNEGFIATGGFIFDRMRFKGNVWKDLKYREESWKLVTSNNVPEKAFILKTWVHQRERDFECCGWNSWLDYKNGGYTILPESCCNRKNRKYECGKNYFLEEKKNTYNTRGCKIVMYDWYRKGFVTNTVIAVIGILVSAFEFVLYAVNRKSYFKLALQLNELKNMKIPQNISDKTSLSNSKTSIYTPVATQAPSDAKRVPLRIPMRNFYNQNNEENDDNDDNYSRITNNRAYNDKDGKPEEREWMF